ncbi:hypothetical protein VTJ04DRAFT_3880 [Mycothermus thermophilus]|uniref:uncharacterized protein n=1 Tax=Humicola insolens TaxID=85995 RepID=UPI00374224E1
MGSDSSEVRLYCPQVPAEEQYTCLSYCWGGPQTVTLTKASFERFLRSIPLADLGQTIQDAVHVTRQLDIRYLWVDALCIIQDSEEDTRFQIGKMSDIYSRATVTIAAADATSSTHGFLRREPSPTDMEANNVGNDKDILPAHKIPFSTGGTVLLYDDSLRLSRGWSDFPLNKRAWTLQEMLLSPRILVYTADDMFWLCTHVEAHILKQQSDFCNLDHNADMKKAGILYEDLMKLRFFSS